MRLETVAQDLSERLRKASPKQQHAASIAACQLALQAASVDEPIALESLEQLRQQGTLSIQRVTELIALAEQLDSEYFELQDQSEINQVFQADALRLFGQARAIAAIAFAGGKDVLTAAMEAIYEASVTVDDPGRVFDAAFVALSEDQR